MLKLVEYPQLNSLEKILSFIMNYCRSDSPDLAAISIIIGSFENNIYENMNLSSKMDFCLDESSLNKMYIKFVKTFSKDKRLTKLLEDKTSSKSEIVKTILDLIWSHLDGKYRKDKPHIQSVFSLLKFRQLDSLGVSLCVVTASDFLKLYDVKLALTESHSWIVFGKDESMEVTWHGRATEDLRGLNVDANMSARRWMYQGGNAMVLSGTQVVATMVSNMDIYKNGNILEPLYLFKMKMLHFLYEIGALEKLPSSLVMLTELVTMQMSRINLQSKCLDQVDNCAINLLPVDLYKESIASSKRFYNDAYVLPYISFGHYYLNEENNCNAIESWAKAAVVISKYSYHKEDDSILKRFSDIMNKIVPKILRKDIGHLLMADNEKILYNILVMYDSICRWEEGGETQLIHSLWVHSLLSAINFFTSAAKQRLSDRIDSSIEKNAIKMDILAEKKHNLEGLIRDNKPEGLISDNNPEGSISDNNPENNNSEMDALINGNTTAYMSGSNFVQFSPTNIQDDEKKVGFSSTSVMKISNESLQFKNKLLKLILTNADKFLLNPSFLKQASGLCKKDEEFYRPFVDTDLTLNLEKVELCSRRDLTKSREVLNDNSGRKKSVDLSDISRDSFHSVSTIIDEVDLTRKGTQLHLVATPEIRSDADRRENFNRVPRRVNTKIPKKIEVDQPVNKTTKRKCSEQKPSSVDLKLGRLGRLAKARKLSIDSVLTDASYIYNAGYNDDDVEFNRGSSHKSLRLFKSLNSGEKLREGCFKSSSAGKARVDQENGNGNWLLKSVETCMQIIGESGGREMERSLRNSVSMDETLRRDSSEVVINDVNRFKEDNRYFLSKKDVKPDSGIKIECVFEIDTDLNRECVVLPGKPGNETSYDSKLINRVDNNVYSFEGKMEQSEIYKATIKTGGSIEKLEKTNDSNIEDLKNEAAILSEDVSNLNSLPDCKVESNQLVEIQPNCKVEVRADTNVDMPDKNISNECRSIVRRSSRRVATNNIILDKIRKHGDVNLTKKKKVPTATLR